MPALQMTGITKGFPGVLALDAVDFHLNAGEIRVLMGENGAGKSTLIKVLTGLYPPDRGTIELEGVPLRPTSPAHAQELGLSTVYQEINLAPNLSVAENIGLGRGGGLVKWRELRQRADQAMSRLGVKVDNDRPVGELPVAVQQLVSIARALDREARVLVLDEPTSSLDRDECGRLFDVMRRLREEGMAILFVTHFLDQVYEVGDSITVLRNGQKIGDWSALTLSRKDLVHHMIGRELEALSRAPKGGSESNDVLIEATGIGKSKTLEPIDLTLRQGEVLGLAGLLGSGRTETLRLLYGSMIPDRGTINGTPNGPKSPFVSVRQGWGLCPEDRKEEGIFPGLSVRENISVVLQVRRGWHRPVPTSAIDKIATDMIRLLGIKTPDANKPIEQLSGGNQQKAILARWLASSPVCLFLDEPTRGIDVGAKADIRGEVRRLANQGMAFIFTSSEIEEVVGTCDRIVVLRDRHKVGELEGNEASENRIMDLISEGNG